MKFEDDPLTVMNEVSLCNLFFVGVVYLFVVKTHNTKMRNFLPYFRTTFCSEL